MYRVRVGGEMSVGGARATRSGRIGARRPDPGRLVRVGGRRRFPSSRRKAPWSGHTAPPGPTAHRSCRVSPMTKRPSDSGVENLIWAVRSVFDLDLADPAQQGVALEMLATALDYIGDGDESVEVGDDVDAVDVPHVTT